MKMKLRGLSALMLTVAAVGCAAIPESQKTTTATIQYLAEHEAPKKLTLKSPVNFTFVSNPGGFNMTTECKLRTGEYVEVARGIDATYYYMKKAIEMKELGITERIHGGIKVPDDEKAPWVAWTYYSNIQGTSTGFSMSSNKNSVREYPALGDSIKQSVEFSEGR